MSVDSRISLCGCVADDHEYETPRKAVLSVDDMQLWEKTEAYRDYVTFFNALNESVKSSPISCKMHVSEHTTATVALLDELDQWIEEYPPIDQPQRFGNQAFKSWHKRLCEDSLFLLQKALPTKLHRAIPEIMVYLTESFGNPTRIDYGTGHEMAFLWFLCCCYKIGYFTAEDNTAVVLKIFNRYMNLVRRLQTVYRMEPAGSHGVWSLDDYQFMPFIWGSAQLVAHPRIEPKSFLTPDIIEVYKNEYLFIACIDFINQVKTGPFPEHSNQLWNISGVSSWSKINQGLIKMYKAEVLSKFPVIQHVLFGSLMTFKVLPTSSSVRGVQLSATPLDPLKHLMNPPGEIRPKKDSEDPSKGTSSEIVRKQAIQTKKWPWLQAVDLLSLHDTTAVLDQINSFFEIHLTKPNSICIVLRRAHGIESSYATDICIPFDWLRPKQSSFLQSFDFHQGLSSTHLRYT